MRACYLDASALVKLATREVETEALRADLEHYDTRVTNRLATVEVARALLRRGVASAVLVDAVTEAFTGLAIVELDGVIAAAAAGVAPPALRSLDAIHLASALAVREELDAVVTYDARMADAARTAGLKVVAPASGSVRQADALEALRCWLVPDLPYARVWEQIASRDTPTCHMRAYRSIRRGMSRARPPVERESASVVRHLPPNVRAGAQIASRDTPTCHMPATGADDGEIG